MTVCFELSDANHSPLTVLKEMLKSLGYYVGHGNLVREILAKNRQILPPSSCIALFYPQIDSSRRE